MTSLNNVISYGVQKLFHTANEKVAFIRNPNSTYVGAGYAYPAGGTGLNLDELVVLSDALETTVYDNGLGAYDPNYSLRQEASIWLNQMIRFTGQPFLPNTTTFSGFLLGGTVNNNVTYKATIVTSGNYHNFDSRDHRIAEHGYVKTGTGWTVAQVTAYLLHGWLVNNIDKSYPRENLKSYVEVIGASAANWTTLNGLINTYKATPTSANYNAVMAQWNTMLTAFFTSAAWTNFVNNPTLANANTLGTAFPVILGRSLDPEVLTFGFSDYFDDINNTLTVTEYLPLVPATPNNGLKGSFGAGTYDAGQKHCQGTHNFEVTIEARPYCKVIQGNEYGELYFHYNAREKTPAIHHENSQMMTLVMFIKMNNGGTAYRIDNGTAVTTGTVSSIGSFNTFVSQLTGAFPELTN
jgi:hypothetical protein